MHMRGHTDDDLMRAFAGGNEDAFSILVGRHRNWVCRLLNAFTHDLDQAEDLAQEVFHRVHRNAGQYRAQGQFIPWLKRIAVNLGKNFLTQKHQAVLVPLSECQQRVAEGRGTDPLVLLMAQAVRSEMREVILSLPDSQRKVIIMRYFGAMSVQDIAAAVNCPEGTVKSRLFHGLRRVRSRMTPHLGEKGEDP